MNKKKYQRWLALTAFVILYLLAGCGVTGHPHPAPVPNPVPVAASQ